jgi:hypothetical protein
LDHPERTQSSGRDTHSDEPATNSKPFVVCSSLDCQCNELEAASAFRAALETCHERYTLKEVAQSKFAGRSLRHAGLRATNSNALDTVSVQSSDDVRRIRSRRAADKNVTATTKNFSRARARVPARKFRAARDALGAKRLSAKAIPCRRKIFPREGNRRRTRRQKISSAAGKNRAPVRRRACEPVG